LAHLNAHRLLAGTDIKAGFKDNISISERLERVPLIAARDLVRETLRTGFRDLSDAGPQRKVVMLERRYVELAKRADFQLAPRFRMQGSFAYHTVNKPAWVPPQEIDLDDGIYLPTSFVGRQEPVIAARAFFAAVETILQPLCNNRGWELCADKLSCVRVVLDTKAHLDLPLYAIPDENFNDPSVVAKRDASSMLAEAQEIEISEARYRRLPADRIMLAKRDGSWEESDPRKIEYWFQDAVNDHGQHLRRVSRYLKAWRDYEWPDQSQAMSSICLMAYAVAVFDDLKGQLPEDRDDIALRHVASRLADLLGQPIQNPVVDGMCLDDTWGSDRRQLYQARARELHQYICTALDGSSPSETIRCFRQVLGDRVPEDVSLCVLESQEETILRKPATVVAAPTVGRSKSG
jgi:hypothetical protein